MTDYISREAAKKAVVEAVGKGYSPFNAIVMLPAADVRPVVLCRDCEYWEREWTPPSMPEGHVCQCNLFVTEDDFFCANGAKLEGSK